MVEASLKKYRIMRDNDYGTVLVGVFEHGDEALNFHVPYVWEDIRDEGKAFSLAIRDKIAETFDIPVYHVDMDNDSFLDTMRAFHMKCNGVIQ